MERDDEGQLALRLGFRYVRGLSQVAGEATVAGCVITRQRPGTAKGIIFMTLEDETGTSRVIISPDFYDKNRMAVLHERFVLVSGVVQNQDTVVHLKARSIQARQSPLLRRPLMIFTDLPFRTEISQRVL